MRSDILPWSDRWLLKLHVSKRKTVFYRRNINHYNYYLHSTELEKVENESLGLTFDPGLSFDFHCEEKINNAYSIVGSDNEIRSDQIVV